MKIRVEVESAFFVVVDTNLFAYETDLLHAPLGLALTSAVRYKLGRIAFPEYLQDEVVKHALERMRTCLSKLRSQVKTLGTLGLPISVQEVEDEELSRIVKSRIGSLGLLAIHFPATESQVRRAHNRVIEDRAPNSAGSQQYKDSLVWEAAVDLTTIAPVYFITKDRAFFGAGGYTSGMAPDLVEDTRKLPHPITLLPNIESFLKMFGLAQVEFDRSELLHNLDLQLRPLIHSVLPRKEITLGGPVEDAELTAFNTETADTFAVQFRVTYEAHGLSLDTDRVDGHLHVAGACLATLPMCELSRIQIHSGDSSSPSFQDGCIRRREFGVAGEDGPLPVYDPPQLIVRKKS